MPSYCDRVLFKSIPTKADRMSLTSYTSVAPVSTSEHKPVLATFSISEPPPIESWAGGGSVGCFQVHIHNFELTRVDDAMLNGRSELYCMFFTNPPGLFDGVPRTEVTASTAHSDSVQWEVGKLPPLFLYVPTVDALKSTCIIVAIFDRVC